MSHWDFGHPADGQQDAPQRSGPAGAPYPPDLPGGTGDDAWPADAGWPAQHGWLAGDGRAARDAWRGHAGWSPDRRWPPAPDGPPAGDRPADAGWPADGGWDDDEFTAPYPLTYERDDSAVADPRPAATAREPGRGRQPT